MYKIYFSNYFIFSIVFTFILLLAKISSKKIPKIYSFKEEEKISKDYTNLINYIKSNGGYVSPKLIPNEISDSNRFIITKQKIKKDEILLFSPDSILISKYHKYVNRKCLEAYGFEEEYDYDCIVYFMTIDKYNSSSVFKPYYNYLPKLDKTEFVFNFTEEEIELFEETGVPEGIGTYHYFLKKSLEPVEQKLKIFAEKNKIKYEQIIEEFKDNFIMVGTRNFGRPGSTFDISTMVPFLDLLNHSDKNNTHWFYDEIKGGYVLVAVRDIEKNEEITDSYGKYYNSLLYRTYGFVIPGNSYHDKVLVKIDGDKFYLDIDSLKSEVRFMFEKLVKVKKFEAQKAKNSILKSLYNKKDYYLKLKTNRFSMNVIIKEHLDILNDYISYVNDYDIN